MQSNTIRFCSALAIVCLLSLFLSNNNVLAQTRQARGVQTQNQAPEMSESSAKAMREIEMMREMIRERREHEEQQRRMLMELQQAINVAEGPAPAAQQQRSNISGTTQHRTQERVTSGSVLSRIEASERAEAVELEKKFNMEIQVAQREIEMLKKQLEIANRQLNQCQAAGDTYKTASSYYEKPAPLHSIESHPAPTRQRPASKRSSERNQGRAPVPQQQEPQSTETKQAMQEIEMMRQMLQERRQQQQEQQRIIRDLQNKLN